MRLVVAEVAPALCGYLVATTAHGRKAGEPGVWIGITPVVRLALVPKIRSNLMGLEGPEGSFFDFRQDLGNTTSVREDRPLG